LSRIITLTTDFGTKDGYAGAVKGVISSINPKAQIVDISHQVPARNILSGAFCLLNAVPSYPQGTIHVAVVDPGVGSLRRPILIQTRRYYFVGPDNGIFDLVLEKSQAIRFIHLANSNHFLG
jgi:S-adenosylmethionine hydrolase